MKRYDVLSQCLMQKQLYSTAAVITSKRDAARAGACGARLLPGMSDRQPVTNAAGKPAKQP